MRISKIKISKIVILSALLGLSFCALAAEKETIKLQNQSGKSAAEGYYLVQDKTWGMPGCVAYLGNKEIKPGESTSFDIKKECKWGGVRFKIFKMANKEFIGELAQSYRDGEVTMEVSAKCKNNECSFKDLNPQQQ